MNLSFTFDARHRQTAHIFLSHANFESRPFGANRHQAESVQIVRLQEAGA